MVEITFYSIPGCSHCANAKQYMDVNKIAYTLIMLETEEQQKVFKANFDFVETMPFFIVEEDGVAEHYSTFREHMFPKINEMKKRGVLPYVGSD